MAIPVVYNLRSVRARWTSAIVAVAGIAGTVGVFVAMLSLARGFRATLVSSGSEDNAIVLRAGATAEMMSGVDLDAVKIIQDAPGVAHDSTGPLVTSEVVAIAPFPLLSTGTDANVQVRGVSANVLTIRKNIKIVEGRMFQPGLSELIVGRNASRTYSGLTLNNTVRFAGGNWTVVGIFDAGGSAFDSEVWSDARVLDDVYKRPTNVFQSITVHLTSPQAFQQFKDSVTSDPRLNVQVTGRFRRWAGAAGRAAGRLLGPGGTLGGRPGAALGLAWFGPGVGLETSYGFEIGDAGVIAEGGGEGEPGGVVQPGTAGVGERREQLAVVFRRWSVAPSPTT